MAQYTKVNGVWQPEKATHVKVGNTWREAKEKYVKVNGTWVKDSRIIKAANCTQSPFSSDCLRVSYTTPGGGQHNMIPITQPFRFKNYNVDEIGAEISFEVVRTYYHYSSYEGYNPNIMIYTASWNGSWIEDTYGYSWNTPTFKRNAEVCWQGRFGTDKGNSIDTSKDFVIAIQFNCWTKGNTYEMDIRNLKISNELVNFVL